MTKADRLALVDAARVTDRVYVWVVVPSEAVTVMLIVFTPTDKAIGADAVPDATIALFTSIVAFGSAAVGVTVIDATPFATFTV